MYMPNMNFRRGISPALKLISYSAMILQFLDLVTRIGTIFLFKYPPKFQTMPPKFIMYLFIYGYTLGGYAIAGIVFESISLFLGMVGIMKQSVATLSIAISSLLVAVTLHVVSSIMATDLVHIKMFDLTSELIWANVGLLILQVVVGLCLTRIRLLFFNNFPQQSQGNQQAGYMLPVVNVPDSRFSPRVMDHKV